MATAPRLTGIFAPSAWINGQWLQNVSIGFDPFGAISSVESNNNPEGFTPAGGPVVPGIPNVHSHAFQRLMAGMSQRRGTARDSFWTWRKVMYELALSLSPDQVRVTATYLYMLMLKAGYTSVGEFHYLHNQTDGSLYADPAEMSLQIIESATSAGIDLTLLPVYYRRSGFGHSAPETHQRRFILNENAYRSVVEKTRDASRNNPGLHVGLAPHSLRAVSAPDLTFLVSLADSLKADLPIHIHVAEQQKEVDDCIAFSGRRPVEWLFNHAPVDRSWCLIHATHVNSSELRSINNSGAVVGLCPTTEADLGDGMFPLREFSRLGGTWSIGSDSHIRIAATEELRWLEYEARLTSGERNVLESPGLSTGETLFLNAVAGGNQALGSGTGLIQPGERANLLVLDSDDPALDISDPTTILDRWIFAAPDHLVRDVIAGGRLVVKDRKHADEDRITQDYRSLQRGL